MTSRVCAPAMSRRRVSCWRRARTRGAVWPVRARQRLKSSKAGTESGKSRTMSKASRMRTSTNASKNWRTTHRAASHHASSASNVPPPAGSPGPAGAMQLLATAGSPCAARSQRSTGLYSHTVSWSRSPLASYSLRHRLSTVVASSSPRNFMTRSRHMLPKPMRRNASETSRNLSVPGPDGSSAPAGPPSSSGNPRRGILSSAWLPPLPPPSPGHAPASAMATSSLPPPALGFPANIDGLRAGSSKASTFAVGPAGSGSPRMGPHHHSTSSASRPPSACSPSRQRSQVHWK
mmetsp:Transcript_117684/g.333530  ORF Transcript_117684/g.333530 Transcript_117684/m.333530 type:complete len:291 (+) Transcript_117684:1931-2803(+)